MDEVAVERGGSSGDTIPFSHSALNNQLSTLNFPFLIPNSFFILSSLFRASMASPEELARHNIDALLTQCGWKVQKRSEINLSAGRGIAITEGLLTGVEEQSGKYGKGLLDIYPKFREPLPFAYESTGVETQFTNRLDLYPKSRNVFAFHRPETLLEWLEPEHQLNTRLASLPTADQMPTANLWSAQIEAIRNLEKSLAANKRRALIQMATGSGKTYTAVNFVYCLIKLAGNLDVLIPSLPLSRSLDLSVCLARFAAARLWLKDESLEDSANLPDPDVIAAEIVEDLEAALQQFAAIAQDLKK